MPFPAPKGRLCAGPAAPPSGLTALPPASCANRSAGPSREPSGRTASSCCAVKKAADNALYGA